MHHNTQLVFMVGSGSPEPLIHMHTVTSHTLNKYMLKVFTSHDTSTSHEVSVSEVSNEQVAPTLLLDAYIIIMIKHKYINMIWEKY